LAQKARVFSLALSCRAWRAATLLRVLALRISKALPDRILRVVAKFPGVFLRLASSLW
jgi:hypothetical protein